MVSRRIRDTEQFVEAKMRFQISRPGKHSLTVHALCDSYVGIDKKVDLNFNVSTEDEVKREVFVHPEDEALAAKQSKVCFNRLDSKGFAANRLLYLLYL